MIISIFKQMERMGMIKEYNIYSSSSLKKDEITGELLATSSSSLKETVKANLNLKKNKDRSKEYKSDSNKRIVGEVYFNACEIYKEDIIEFENEKYTIRDCIKKDGYLYIDAEQ